MKGVVFAPRVGRTTHGLKIQPLLRSKGMIVMQMRGNLVILPAMTRAELYIVNALRRMHVKFAFAFHIHSQWLLIAHL